MSGHEQYLKAMQMLEAPERYPGLAERPYARTLLRLWRYPSFEPYSSWALIETKSQVFLRRVTWDQTHVLGMPVTFGSEAPIEAQAPAYEELLARLRDIQLPPFIKVATCGIDGTSYGVEIGAFGLSARLSWWETPPPEWAALVSWHAETVEKFDGLLPASTPDIYRG
jgi:hypothetical protein